MFTIYIEITTKVIYKMAMDPCELQECLPGDVVSVSASAKLGPGLRLEEDGTVVATQGGLLRHRDRKAFWIDAYSKRVGDSHACELARLRDYVLFVLLHV